MKLLFFLMALLSAPAFAAPTVYINVGDCMVEGRPDSSFRVMVDGATADSSQLSNGLLIFKEVEDPETPGETLTMAISTVLEKQADGGFAFENLLIGAPGQKVLLKSNAVAKTTVGKFTVLCKGKKF
jgi:hypothetical protein